MNYFNKILYKKIDFACSLRPIEQNLKKNQKKKNIYVCPRKKNTLKKNTQKKKREKMFTKFVSRWNVLAKTKTKSIIFDQNDILLFILDFCSLNQVLNVCVVNKNCYFILNGTSINRFWRYT